MSYTDTKLEMGRFTLINKLTELIDLAERWDVKDFSFDTEFTDLNWYNQRLIGMSIYSKKSRFDPIFIQFNFWDTYITKEKDPKGGRKKIDVEHLYRKEDAIEWDDAKPYIYKIFQDAKCTCASAKVEYKIFRKYGIDNWEIEHDVNLMSWLLNVDTPNDLKWNTTMELGVKMPSYEDTIKQKPGNINWNLVDWYEYAEYGARDAWATENLKYVFYPRIKEFVALQQCYENLEIPLLPEVANSEMAGVSIDVEFLKNLSVIAGKEIKILEQEIFDKVGVEFNISSPKQLADILFDRLGYPVLSVSEKTGARSTNEDTLKELAFRGHEVADDILDYRKFVKLKSTYMDSIPLKLDPDGRLRGSLNQQGAATGRFSSSNPNLQNIPNDKRFPIKAGFIPRPGYKFLVYDWSTIEIRVMAHESNDEVMIKMLQDGFDVHQGTTDSINEQYGTSLDRDQGKCVVPQTVIKTEKGFVDIGDCNLGREADTFYPSKYKSVLANGDMIPIKNFYNNGSGAGRIIVTRRGIIGASMNHRMVTGSNELVRVEDLNKGDILNHQDIKGDLGIVPEIMFNPFFTKGGKDFCRLTLDKDWGYFLGAFEGDGSYLKTGKSVGFSIGRGGKYEVWADELHKLFLKIGLADNQQRKPTNKSNSKYLGSSNLALFLEKLGVGKIGEGKTHRIPKVILNASRELKLAYLSGLIDTDGYIGDTVSITAKNIYLMQDLCILLNTLGYDYGLAPKYNKKYGVWYYTLHIYSDSILEFSKEHQLKCAWKIEALEKRVIPIINRKAKGIGKTPMRANEILQIIELDSTPLVDIEVDSDEHLYTANCLYGHNTINFAVLYLMGKRSLAYTLNKDIKKRLKNGSITKAEYMKMHVSENMAQQIIDGFFNNYYGFAQYVEDITENVRDTGWVWTLGGRRRPVPELRNKKTYGFGRRKACNSPIQGGAGDLMKKCIVELAQMYKKFGFDATTLLYIHDEYVIEVREDQAEKCAEQVQKLMENIFPDCKVPIKCEGGIFDNWNGLKGGAKPIKLMQKKAVSVVNDFRIKRILKMI